MLDIYVIPSIIINVKKKREEPLGGKQKWKM